LTGQQLYDILYQSSMMTSGSKDEKVNRIIESHWSERSILNYLRKDDLTQLCRKFLLPTSGSKQEIIDRLIEFEPLSQIGELSEKAVEESKSDSTSSNLSNASQNLQLEQPKA